jgi:membrane protease YdiL (CAAX protease family)
MSPLSRFFVWSFALCFVITVPIALAVQGVLPEVLPRQAQFLIGFVPIVAAALAARRDPHRVTFWQDALRLRAGALDWTIALLLPWAVLALAFAFALVTGTAAPELQWNLPLLAGSFLLWTLMGWGEEAGWRAYALPRMLRSMSFLRATTVLGVVWALWHYPRNFASPYFAWNAESFWYLAVFSLQIVLGNYLLCWMFRRTRSAPVCAVFHGSTNLVATAWWSAGMDWRMVAAYALVLGGGVLWTRRNRAAPALGPAI